MNILCITHADFESPGVIVDWAQARGHGFTICKPYAQAVLPSVSTIDALIVMGGPQSPLNTAEAPYLVDEIAYIQSAITAPKKTLGFCLGAQLIGEALGARTTHSPHKEVGIYPITITSEGRLDPLLTGLGDELPAIHWHNDMPGLTPQATVLGFSAGCPRQIIRYMPHVYGFQCHLEITRTGIQTMIEAVPGDLAPSLYTQSEATLIAQDYEAIHQQMFNILDRWSLIQI